MKNDIVLSVFPTSFYYENVIKQKQTHLTVTGNYRLAKSLAEIAFFICCKTPINLQLAQSMKGIKGARRIGAKKSIISSD